MKPPSFAYHALIPSMKPYRSLNPTRLRRQSSRGRTKPRANDELPRGATGDID